MSTENDDVLNGDGGRNRILSIGGNDTVTGNGGTDSLYGGSGDDTLYGDQGPDPVVLISDQFFRSASGWQFADGGAASTAYVTPTYLEGGGSSPEEIPESSNGNIRGTDSTTGAGYFVAPSTYYSALANAVGGNISFDVYADLNGTSTGTPDNLGRGVAITGTDAAGNVRTVFYNKPLAATEETWVTNNVQLVGANFSVSDADFEAIMSSVTDFRILGEFYSGPAGNDASQLDNVVLSASPDAILTDGLGDYLFGQSGNDTLIGGEGGDIIYGGIGNDTIDGGVGNDAIYGEGTSSNISQATSFFENGTEGWTYSNTLGSERIELEYLEQGKVSGSGGVQATDPGGGLSYYHANDDYLGDQSTVYGGEIKFSQYLDLDGFPYDQTRADTQIKITGANGQVLSFRGFPSDTTPDTYVPYVLTDQAWTDVAIPIEEGYWLINGQPATAAEMQAVLADVDDFAIQAEYSSYPTDSTRLDNVFLNANPAYSTDATGLVPANTDDVIHGGLGNDFISGGTGNDTLFGDEGDDRIVGGGGNDTIDGGAGADRLEGGIGDDKITVGLGDTALGGDDRDTFVLDPTQTDGTTFTIDGGSGSTAPNDADDFDTIDLNGLTKVAGSYQGTIDPDSVDSDNPSRTGTVQVTDGTNIYTINFSEIEGPICFARGSLIATFDGEKPVEELVAGDLILTKDNGFKPIMWINSNTLQKTDDMNVESFAPVRIGQGSLGHGLPKQDLYVSPQHRILVRSEIAQRMFGADEVLVPAKQLTVLDGIDQVMDFEAVEYIHFLFDQHEIVYSNGLETESLYTGAQALKSMPKESVEELFALFPELVNMGDQPKPARQFANGRKAQNMALKHGQKAIPLQ